MLRRIISRAAAASFLAFAALLPARMSAEVPADGWDMAARIVERIHAPEFPDRKWLITKFGAVEGADCTAALRSAIEACHAQGGGHVIVPAGTYLTGAIRLLGGVDLHLEEGATLRFLTDPNAYLPAVFTRWEGTECMNYSAFIYAFDAENIGVSGKGTLDGAATDGNWWEWASKENGRKPRAAADVAELNRQADAGIPPEKRVFGAGHFLRPNFFQPYRCRNVLIEGVAIVRSPMWEVNPVLCTNVIVRGLRISSPGPNNDGCDPESCRDVLVEKCSFTTGDDCIAIKSGRNDDGRRIGVAVENLIIRDCAMLDGHAGVAIGSEISGGCRNVFVENCHMDSPHLERALRLKSNARRGGVIEGIHMRHIAVGTVSEALLTVDFMYEEGPNGHFPPVIRNVSIEDVTVKSSPRVLFIQGFAAATIDDIRIAHCTVAGVTEPEIVSHAGRIDFDHVDIIPARAVRSQSSRALE